MTAQIAELCGSGNLSSSDAEETTSTAAQGSVESTSTKINLKYRDAGNRLVDATFKIERDLGDTDPVLPWVSGGVPVTVTVERTDV
jgi:hypothetical protein